MENLGKFKFNLNENGSFSVTAEFTYFGKDTDKGIIWFIPSIDTWFQTKTEDQAEKVATRLMDHFLDVYLIEDNSPQRFTKKLKEIGWTNLPSPKPIAKKGLQNEVIYTYRVLV